MKVLTQADLPRVIVSLASFTISNEVLRYKWFLFGFCFSFLTLNSFQDFNAPHFKYIDDPYLIPASSLEKVMLYVL